MLVAVKLMRKAQVKQKSFEWRFEDWEAFCNNSFWFATTHFVKILGILKTLKLSKDWVDALVHSKWRWLIRGTEEGSDDSGG